MTADADRLEARLSGWEHFTELCETPNGRAELGTPDVVEALLNRDAIEEDARRGLIDAERLARADDRYRMAATSIRAKTQIALYGTEKAAAAWWWRAGADVPQSDEVLNVPRAADLKGVHEHTVRAAIGRGDLAARRLGRGFVMARSDVLAWQPRPVGRPPASPPHDPIFADFVTAIRGRDWVRADEAASRAREEPTNGERAAIVAHAQLASGATHEALEWIGRARGLGVPGVLEQALTVVQALALARLDQTDEAIRLLRDAVDARPDDIGAIGGLATVLWDTGATDEARNLLKDAIAGLENPGELEFLLAERLFRDGHLGSAMRHITRFREQHPVHSEALLLEGVILGQLGDDTNDSLAYEEALDLFEDSRLPASDQFVGITLGRLGRWKEALELSANLTTEARSLVVQAALLSALQRGGLESAVAAARLDQELGSNDPLARAILALAASSGEPGQARSLLTPGFGPYRSDDEATISTVAWIAAGQPGPAVSLLLGALHDPDATTTRLVLLAAAAIANDRPGEAEQALDRLASFDDEHGVLARVTLDLLRRKGRRAHAPGSETPSSAQIGARTATALVGRGAEGGTQTLHAELVDRLWGPGVVEAFASSKNH